MMSGKGGGKPGRYQGKCQKLENRGAVEHLLRETVKHEECAHLCKTIEIITAHYVILNSFCYY